MQTFTEAVEGLNTMLESEGEELDAVFLEEISDLPRTRKQHEQH